MKLPSKGLIHGEQTFHYERPLLVEEEIYCYSKVEKYYEKKGSNDQLGFLVIKGYGEEPSGEIIFTTTQTIIITETVRKAMIE